jgi:pimeloyl-ACP methyl ester carboxylesterase
MSAMSAWIAPRSAVAFAVLLFATFHQAWTQTISSSGLTPQLLQQAIEAAQLSLAVYDLSKKMVQGGWSQIESTLPDPDGLQAAAYERKLANGKRELVIAFAGTRVAGGLNPADAVVDVNQGSGLGGPVFDFLTYQRFHEALNFAETYVKQKDKDPNTTITIVGHSLGGLLAQYVGVRLGVRAIVFDASALFTKNSDLEKNDWLKALDFSAKFYGWGIPLGEELALAVAANLGRRNTVSRQITHFFLRDDPVHEPTLLIPGARDFGFQVRIDPKPDLPPTESGHSMEGMIASLEYLNSRLFKKAAHVATPNLVERAVPSRTPTPDAGKPSQRNPLPKPLVLRERCGNDSDDVRCSPPSVSNVPPFRGGGGGGGDDPSAGCPPSDPRCTEPSAISIPQTGCPPSDPRCTPPSAIPIPQTGADSDAFRPGIPI